MTIRGFTTSSSVPPLPSFSERDSPDSLYRTARGERQDRPGVIPLDLLPRRCPVCQDHTIIGHGRRLRQAHDDQQERIWVRRGICHPCKGPSRSCPMVSCLRRVSVCVADSKPASTSLQVIPCSKPRRSAKICCARPIHLRCADGCNGACSACVGG